MSLLGFVPVLVVFGLYVVSIRLSARLFRRSRLSWKHSLQFSVIVMSVAIGGRALQRFYDWTVPLPAGLIIGVSLQVALGGWFLGPRACSASGQPLGFSGGAQLTALWLAFVMVVV